MCSLEITWLFKCVNSTPTEGVLIYFCCKTFLWIAKRKKKGTRNIYISWKTLELRQVESQSVDRIPVCIKAPAGEWPTWTELHGPGDDVGIKPAGLGTWRGLEGELASNPPGEGCGNMEGEGLIVAGKLGGEAKLKDVAGEDPKLWWFV